jgi:hypothetical protein
MIGCWPPVPEWIAVPKEKHPIEKARQIQLAGFSYSSFDSAYVCCSSPEQLPNTDEDGYWENLSKISV